MKSKVLFGDFSSVKSQKVVEDLKKFGVESVVVTDGPSVITQLTNEHFDACILNLLLGGVGPFEMISNMRKKSKNPNLRIIVTSQQVQKSNIQNTIRAGADDFVAEPYEVENLVQKVLYHLSPRQVVDPSGYEKSGWSQASSPYLTLLLETTEMLSRTPRDKIHKACFQVVSKISTLIHSNRTSFILLDEVNQTGVVLASSDDEKFFDFQLSLQKYPEILHVMYSGQFVQIEDTAQNAMTSNIGQTVQSIEIGSMMVFPVRFEDEVRAVLTIRRAKANALPALEVMRILQSIANSLAAQAHIRALWRKIYQDFTSDKNSPKKAA